MGEAEGHGHPLAEVPHRLPHRLPHHPVLRKHRRSYEDVSLVLDYLKNSPMRAKEIVNKDNKSGVTNTHKHELPRRRHSAWDLVLAGVAMGGYEQLAVGGLQLVHREPVVPIAAQGDVFEHR